ncbi:MAG: hypothetical protein IJ083_04545, partial [Clostridia bacterium]|nr:hypothetical protein [Clostridia bacterium]
PRSDSLKGHELCWFLRDGDTQAPDRVAALPVVASGSVSASALDSAMCLHAYDTIQNLQLWHFDRPKLYTLDLQLRNPKGETVDQICSAIGFRTLRRIGTRLYLNGEPVRLPGMEWMPGSSPDSGMAESPEEMYSMLQLLKDAGCTLTRFHWQQSEEVLSWCDRHGLLAQEEIPFWGKVPEDDQLKMWPVAQQQLRDTICAHFNHPSIISWGVGNELAGASEQAQLYVRRAVALCRELDPSRLACYVSDTALRSPMHDGTESGDVMMVNDYIGTWHGNLDSEATWQTFCASHPDAVFIPSEFGLCEPAFDGGDERRGRIFLEKLQQYRRIPQVAGTIYFCLNDYRTHMGEDGDGKFRQRIHGSCGLRGEKKPSYAIVQREYLPLTISRDGQKVILRCRDDLPSYTLRGYVLRGGKDDSYTVALPTLHPGETFETTTFKLGKSVEIVRADGSLVLRCNIADL